MILLVDRAGAAKDAVVPARDASVDPWAFVQGVP